MKKGVPISPDDLPDMDPYPNVPSEVIDCYNEFIVRHWDQSSATFYAEDIRRLLPENQITMGDIWNIQKLYGRHGWKVKLKGCGPKATLVFKPIH